MQVQVKAAIYKLELQESIIPISFNCPQVHLTPSKVLAVFGIRWRSDFWKISQGKLSECSEHRSMNMMANIIMGY